MGTRERFEPRGAGGGTSCGVGGGTPCEKRDRLFKTVDELSDGECTAESSDSEWPSFHSCDGSVSSCHGGDISGVGESRDLGSPRGSEYSAYSLFAPTDGDASSIGPGSSDDDSDVSSGDGAVDSGHDHRVARGTADAVCIVGEYGVLRVYDRVGSSGKKYIVATCFNGHGNDCVLERSCLESKREGNLSEVTLGQGRPIGLLVKWLMLGACENVHNRFEHVRMTDATQHQARCDARTFFYTLAGGEDFAKLAERRQRLGEPVEPKETK